MTPRQVRSALKKAGLKYDIFKLEGSWYLSGGDTIMWNGSCLYVSNFQDCTPEMIVEWVRSMENANKK
jgi:hypothetical protein